MAAVFPALHQNFVSTASAVFTQLWFKSTYSINHTPNEIKGKSRTPSRRMLPANTPLEELSVRQLKTLLKQKGLPISGRKAELIERLIGPQSNINPAPPLKPINPAPPLKSSHPMPLEQMKVPQLKSLLKLRGLPVSGKKAELIERLKNGARREDGTSSSSAVAASSSLSEASSSLSAASSSSSLQASMVILILRIFLTAL